MSEEKAIGITPPEAPTMAMGQAEAKPNTVTFATKDHGIVGTLYLDPPMRFEGDADESARVFFECVKVEFERRADS